MPLFFAILRGGIIVSRVQLVPGGREGERADSFRNWWSMGGSVIVANNAKSFYQILPRPPSPLSSSLFLLGDDRKCVQVQLVHGGREGGVDGGQRDLSTFLMLGLVSKLRESVHAVAQLLVERNYWILSLIFGQSSYQKQEQTKHLTRQVVGGGVK